MNHSNDTDEDDKSARYRANLVEGLRGAIRDARVLGAMQTVPRHRFVDGVSARRAYRDDTAPIGFGQTISQPTVVALMTAALELTGCERVLEIGTGSGYQAAILSLLAARVYSIERFPELADKARRRLARLGYDNVEVRAGDGFGGWPEAAPFDRIILTAAPAEVPAALLGQLAEGGVLVAPVGPEGGAQTLLQLRKTGANISQRELGSVWFVPMVPAAQ